MKNRHIALAFVAALFAIAPAFTFAGDPPPAATAKPAIDASKLDEKQKVSYIIGTQVGESIRQNQISLDYDLLLAGLRAAAEGNDNLFSLDEKNEIMSSFQQKMMAKMQAEKQKLAIENQAAADKFLAENKTKEGVITTASGLQYKVNATGEGASPTDTSTVIVRYNGVFQDGTEFDNNLEAPEPAHYRMAELVVGWQEALKLMKPGSKFSLWVPPNLAYANSGRPGIPPNAMLIFELELVGIE